MTNFCSLELSRYLQIHYVHANNMKAALIAIVLLFDLADGFIPTKTCKSNRPRQSAAWTVRLRSTNEDSGTTVKAISIDPKDAVRVFGRLAEKYIMLDESGGMCCYSGCKDCEFRLPDGGYKMADQSASRPKWIPVYEQRSFAGQGKDHVAKWKVGIYDASNKPAVTKEEFVTALVGMEYSPPLGGPFVAASAASLVDNTAVVEYLFDILAEGKEKLARYKMSLRLKDLANGEQGLTWPAFQAALGL
jgi:hypothetical protein